MNIFAIIFASLLIAGNASALGFGNDNNGGNTDVDVSQDVDVDVRNTNTNINTNVADADAKATSIQGQEQGQFQAQGNSQKLTIEDASNPASSAATLVLANCTSGASAQGFGGGGSLGGPDDVCQLLNFAQVAAVFGGEKGAEQSAWALGEAQNILKVRANVFRRMLQALPIVGKIM